MQTDTPSSLKYQVNYIVHGMLTADKHLIKNIMNLSSGDALIAACVEFTAE